MKGAFVVAALAIGCHCVIAEDILFTNRIASFTNLQGQVYKRVQLIRGDLDGLIWRDAASGGRICYTNLHPDILEYFGISSNRIEVARARAEKKALADARYRATVVVETRSRPATQVTNVDGTVSAQNEFAGSSNPALAYNPYPMYPPALYYGYPLFDDLGPPAPSAPSASSVASAPGAIPAMRAGSAPGAGSAAIVLPAHGFGTSPSAPSARSAPLSPLGPGRRP